MKRFLLVLFLTLTLTGICIAGEKSIYPATAGIYYDTATGHKYIQNKDHTYSEYSKRGKLLRSDVPNTQPLLTTGKYILEVTPLHFLVYEKKTDQILTQKIMRATNSHPEGWKCKQIVSGTQLVSTD
jgi:hypothetical protein